MKRPLATLLAWVCLVAPGRGEPWTLERALDEALARNPEARIAQQRMASARAGLEQAQAAFWPRLQLQSSYTRTDNPMQVFGSILNQRSYSSSLDFNDVPDTDNLNVKGLLTVPLYAGGRHQAVRQAAKADTAAAQSSYEAVRNTLAFEVSRAFHTILKLRQFVRAAEAGVRAFESNVGAAQKRLEAGSVLKADVLDIQVQLAHAREQLIAARNGQSLAERALRHLLGIETGELTIVDSVPLVQAPATSDFSGRAELAAARWRERSAMERLRASKAGYLPSVSAFGSVDYDHGWRFNQGGGSYMGGALVQWDLCDGQLTRAKAREAEAQLEIAREETRQLRLALDLEAERARLELATANERLKVTEQVVAQAEESAAITRSRFEQAMALSTQVIDAETALIAARVRRAEAEADQRIAVAALRKALGLPQLSSAPNP